MELMQHLRASKQRERIGRIRGDGSFMTRQRVHEFSHQRVCESKIVPTRSKIRFQRERLAMTDDGLVEAILDLETMREPIPTFVEIRLRLHDPAQLFFS